MVDVVLRGPELMREGAAEQDLAPYERAFGVIDADPAHLLVVGAAESGVWVPAMIGWTIQEARRRGCDLVQLTTDKRRLDAHRFCERLGFVASHEGMKLRL